jgi:hypothetical protein
VVVRLKVEPVHCGVLLPAVGVGNGLITTVADPFIVTGPVEVLAKTVYVPAAVCNPKLMAVPSPFTGEPILTPFN